MFAQDQSHEGSAAKAFPGISPNLQPEFEYFMAHHDEIAREHEGQVVVIKGGAVLGYYRNVAQAVAATVRQHQLGTFLAQLVSRDPASYTQTFYSRAVVA